MTRVRPIPHSTQIQSQRSPTGAMGLMLATLSLLGGCTQPASPDVQRVPAETRLSLALHQEGRTAEVFHSGEFENARINVELSDITYTLSAGDSDGIVEIGLSIIPIHLNGAVIGFEDEEALPDGSISNRCRCNLGRVAVCAHFGAPVGPNDSAFISGQIRFLQEPDNNGLGSNFFIEAFAADRWQDGGCRKLGDIDVGTLRR